MSPQSPHACSWQLCRHMQYCQVGRCFSMFYELPVVHLTAAYMCRCLVATMLLLNKGFRSHMLNYNLGLPSQSSRMQLVTVWIDLLQWKGSRCFQNVMFILSIRDNGKIPCECCWCYWKIFLHYHHQGIMLPPSSQDAKHTTSSPPCICISLLLTDNRQLYSSHYWSSWCHEQGVYSWPAEWVLPSQWHYHQAVLMC